MAKVEAYAKAQKDFFIDMLTRDISLIDCILDLLDNSIDGANRELQRRRIAPTKEDRFAGFRADVEVSARRFLIKDNCGGMTVSLATKYAFAFGKREGAPEPKHSIGLYGIGMKRAIFKMGNLITISSRTHADSFQTTIDVPDWRDDEDKWNFDLETAAGGANTGTSIHVTTLHEDVKLDFEDAEFLRELRRSISRDYMFILRNGFVITINGDEVKPLAVYLLTGNGYKPLRQRHKLRTSERRSVELEIIAGLWKRADTDDDDPEANEPIDPGWYVVCNDRVVLPGDTSARTGWGSDKYIDRKWHSQYKPFVGFALFSSDDPALLPWTTTKRGVDLNSDIYRQALSIMADATKPAIDYTNSRKGNRDRAEASESRALKMHLLGVSMANEMRFPQFVTTAERLASISYQINQRRLKTVKLQLGDPSLPNRDVGLQTFEYYFKHEVGD